MSELTNPSDIARETLRLLASRRIAPTPDNYRQHYREIGGVPDAAAPAEAERMLQRLSADLRAQPNTARLAGALEQAADERTGPDTGPRCWTCSKPRPARVPPLRCGRN